MSDFTATARLVNDTGETETDPGEEETDPGEEETDPGETGGGDDAEEEETVYDPGTIYSLNFSDWHPSNSGYYPDNQDFFLNGTLDDKNFFKVTGNLSVIHGSITWDLDGDGTVDTDKETLDACLKMEPKLSNADNNPTNITFTSEEGGYLRLVFSSEAATNSVTVTDSKGNATNYYATNNQIYEYLDAGTYTISRSSYCFLYYVEFAEGADKVAKTASTSYIHNFNNGLASDGFYTISGDLSHSYGSISYKGVSATQCLKMGSKASVTFTSEESGTLYLIMTNPKDSKRVGIILDGTEVLATATNYKNSVGYTIYEVTTRLTAGTHTITRINSTENMLYYVEYIPDNYGGKSWETDSEDQVLGKLYEKSEETYTAYLKYAQKVGTYTLSANTG
ncbi:MAG: hypothetical protein LUC90_05755 [Lachnospiraceae bacterium]|nr:hypothetical protein [Lachnospiraceae bacterium]